MCFSLFIGCLKAIFSVTIEAHVLIGGNDMAVFRTGGSVDGKRNPVVDRRDFYCSADRLCTGLLCRYESQCSGKFHGKNIK